jgi:hypothetical protein
MCRGTRRHDPGEKIPSGLDRKRQVAREYAWSAPADSGIIALSRNRNLIGK